MMLEAVWFKNGKEIYKVSPVMNIVCEDEMKSVREIEVEIETDVERSWHSCVENNFDADDFVIRVKRN